MTSVPNDEPFPNPHRIVSAGSETAPGLTKLLGPSLLSAQGQSRIQTAQLQAEVIGVYFSAHW